MAVVQHQIQHIAAMAVVGKTLRSANLSRSDLHLPIADFVRGPVAMVIEEINQRHKYWLSISLFGVSLPAERPRSQKSFDSRSLCSRLKVGFEWSQCGLNLG